MTHYPHALPHHSIMQGNRDRDIAPNNRHPSNLFCCLFALRLESCFDFCLSQSLDRN
jgi:hypothetical protein